MSLLVVGGLAVSTIFVSSSVADAGIFKKRGFAMERDYHDYAYAKWLWDNVTTFEKLTEEEKKYSKEYDPWYASWKKDSDRAIIEIDTLAKDSAIKRGYDIQLSYDEWRDNVYTDWMDSYKKGHEKRTFDQYLQYYAVKRGPCAPGEKRTYLDMCGPFPDWRSPEDKKKEQEMMAEADKANAKP